MVVNEKDAVVIGRALGTGRLSSNRSRLASPGYSIQYATKDALVDITGDVDVAFGAARYSPGRRSIAYLNVVTRESRQSGENRRLTVGR